MLGNSVPQFYCRCFVVSKQPPRGRPFPAARCAQCGVRRTVRKRMTRYTNRFSTLRAVDEGGQAPENERRRQDLPEEEANDWYQEAPPPRAGAGLQAARR